MTKIDSGEKYIHYETDDFDHPDFHTGSMIFNTITGGTFVLCIVFIFFLSLLKPYLESNTFAKCVLISFGLMWLSIGINRIGVKIGEKFRARSKGISQIETFPSKEAYLFIGKAHSNTEEGILSELVYKPVICLPSDISYIQSGGDASSVLLPCVIREDVPSYGRYSGHGNDNKAEFWEFFQRNSYPGRVIDFSRVPNPYDDAEYNKIRPVYLASGQYIAPLLNDIESHRCRVKIYKNTAYLEFYNCDLGFEPEYGESDA